jgi:hypothetical protein
MEEVGGNMYLISAAATFGVIGIAASIFSGIVGTFYHGPFSERMFGISSCMAIISGVLFIAFACLSI